jgi:hypothetical protein
LRPWCPACRCPSTPCSRSSSELGAWADVGNLDAVSDEAVRLLLSAARGWLELGGVERLLHYLEEGEEEQLALLERSGFRVLTRTRRGWVR